MCFSPIAQPAISNWYFHFVFAVVAIIRSLLRFHFCRSRFSHLFPQAEAKGVAAADAKQWWEHVVDDCTSALEFKVIRDAALFVSASLSLLLSPAICLRVLILCVVPSRSTQTRCSGADEHSRSWTGCRRRSKVCLSIVVLFLILFVC